MSSAVEVRVPNIGDFKDVPIIEVLVKPGDVVTAESPVVTIESEKSSMEIPSPSSGTVETVTVKVGDKVSEGSPLFTFTAANGAATAAAPAAPAAATPAAAAPAAPAPAPAAAGPIDVKVPNIGDFKDVPVIDILVKVGDEVVAETAIVTVESEKASMDIPSPGAGIIASIAVKIGDKVSEGSPLFALTPKGGAAAAPAAAAPAAAAPAPAAAAAPAPAPAPAAADPAPPASTGPVHASPSIRRFARELGVGLGEVKGTGPNGRITKEDVQGFVKAALAAPRQAAGGGAPFNLPPWPKVDFAQFGPIERKALPRIKKISGPVLHRNWVSIPHVTNNEEADITELEAFRKQLNAEDPKAKLTILAFAIKAVVAALKAFPDFNASLDGDDLVLKQYYHIGFAADTPNGLVVPVLKDADKKGVLAISAETRDMAAKARDGKLGLSDMQGGTFTISSLGGIGGTTFTPIINAPEVAILGLSRSSMKPTWDGKEFKPRLILPLSLSYDHRVIDGAAAARFNAYLASALADLRRTVL